MCYLQNKFNVADFKAEKFSKLSHLLLSGQVIVEQTAQVARGGASSTKSSFTLC